MLLLHSYSVLEVFKSEHLSRHRTLPASATNVNNYLAILVTLASFPLLSKGLSRGSSEGVSFINFKPDEFSYLNITNIGSNLVEDGSECGFTCLEIPSCFSYNLASPTNRDVDAKLLCELLPSDKYNNSDKFMASPLFHHFSIPSPCSSWPCQNNGICISQYEKDSFVCVCPKKHKGKYCQVIGCENDICLNNGTCTEGANGFQCSCPPGFNGDRCGTGLEESNILSEHGGSIYIQDLSKLLFPVLQNPSSKWDKCWRAQLDGWRASTFHSNCDAKGPTVTIVRVGSYIFGGYTSANWSNVDPVKCVYQYDNKAFIFSLNTTNGYSPTKFKIKHAQHAIYPCSTEGPSFGKGHDLGIKDLGEKSFTFASSYVAPSGCGAFGYCPVFAGSNIFNPSDIEVFYEQ